MLNFSVTIDGLFAVGKSSVAKRVAQKFRIAFLDAGTFFRALTIKAIIHKIDLND